MAINTAKIEEVVNSEAFAESMKGVQSIEDIRKAFADNGVELTVEEVVRVANDIMGENAAELSADDLDEVSGGACRNDLEHAIAKVVFALPNFILTYCGAEPIHCDCHRTW